MGIDAKMYVRTSEPVTDAQLVKWSFDAGAVFGARRFWIDRANKQYALEREDEDAGCLAPPKKGETTLRVNLWSRYWGPGYERGDVAFLITLAAWLEKRIPGARVFYGGDGGGGRLPEFDAALRDKFIEHAASEHGHDYFTYEIDSTRSRQQCTFCDQPMRAWSFGPIEIKHQLPRLRA